MRQPELSAGAAVGKGTDRLAPARAAYPGARFLWVYDPAGEREYLLAMPPASPWHPRLPEEQVIEVQPHEHAGRG